MKDAFLTLVVGFFIGGPAWLIGYPYITMYQAMEQQRAHAGGDNILRHDRASVDQNTKTSKDMLDSVAVLDLGKGPLLLTLPATGDRYWSVQFMALSTEIEGLISRRNQGGVGGQFVLATDGWQGDVPDGTTVIRLPSNCYWMQVRIGVDGSQSDLALGEALQDKMILEKL